jgi:hypothetical protein
MIFSLGRSLWYGGKEEGQIKQAPFRLLLITSKFPTTIISRALSFPQPTGIIGNSSGPRLSQGENSPTHQFRQLIHIDNLYLCDRLHLTHFQWQDRYFAILQLRLRPERNTHQYQILPQGPRGFQTLWWWKYCSHRKLPNLSRWLNQTAAPNTDSTHPPPHQTEKPSHYAARPPLESLPTSHHHHAPFLPHLRYYHQVSSWYSSNNLYLPPEISTNVQTQKHGPHRLKPTHLHHGAHKLHHTIRYPQYQNAYLSSPRKQPEYVEKESEDSRRLNLRSSHREIQSTANIKILLGSVFYYDTEYMIPQSQSKEYTYQPTVILTMHYHIRARRTHPYSRTPTEFSSHSHASLHIECKNSINRTNEILCRIAISYQEYTTNNTNKIHDVRHMQTLPIKRIFKSVTLITTLLTKLTIHSISILHPTLQQHQGPQLPQSTPHRLPNHHLPNRTVYTRFFLHHVR